MTTLQRIAMKLNNGGVSLLQRGQHQDALETLRDAVEVMNLTWQHQADPAFSSTTDVTAMLQQEARRLASLYTSCKAVSSLSAPMHVLSDDCSPAVLRHMDSSDTVVFVMDSDLSGPSYSGDESLLTTDLHAATLLLNCGMAYKMRALSEELHSDFHLSRALRQLQMAHMLLSSLCDGPIISLVGPCIVRKIVLIATVVLKSMIELNDLSSNKLPIRVTTEYKARLSQMFESAERIGELEPKAAGAA